MIYNYNLIKIIMANTELISKIFARYKHWIWEEKQAAKNILEKMGVDIEDLKQKDEIRKDYKIKIDTINNKLFAQVFWYFKDKIIESDKIDYLYLKRDKRYKFLENFSEQEYLDFIDCWKHYKKLYEQELRTFYSAFLYKNDIFWNPRNIENQKTMDQKEALKIEILMKGIKEDKYKKTLLLN